MKEKDFCVYLLYQLCLKFLTWLVDRQLQLAKERIIINYSQSSFHLPKCINELKNVKHSLSVKKKYSNRSRKKQKKLNVLQNYFRIRAFKVFEKITYFSIRIFDCGVIFFNKDTLDELYSLQRKTI